MMASRMLSLFAGLAVGMVAAAIEAPLARQIAIGAVADVWRAAVTWAGTLRDRTGQSPQVLGAAAASLALVSLLAFLLVRRARAWASVRSTARRLNRVTLARLVHEVEQECPGPADPVVYPGSPSVRFLVDVVAPDFSPAEPLDLTLSLVPPDGTPPLCYALQAGHRGGFTRGAWVALDDLAALRARPGEWEAVVSLVGPRPRRLGACRVLVVNSPLLVAQLTMSEPLVATPEGVGIEPNGLVVVEPRGALLCVQARVRRGVADPARLSTLESRVSLRRDGATLAEVVRPLVFCAEGEAPIDASLPLEGSAGERLWLVVAIGSRVLLERAVVPVTRCQVLDAVCLEGIELLAFNAAGHATADPGPAGVVDPRSTLVPVAHLRVGLPSVAVGCDVTFVLLSGEVAAHTCERHVTPDRAELAVVSGELDVRSLTPGEECSVAVMVNGVLCGERPFRVKKGRGRVTDAQGRLVGGIDAGVNAYGEAERVLAGAATVSPV